MKEMVMTKRKITIFLDAARYLGRDISEEEISRIKDIFKGELIIAKNAEELMKKGLDSEVLVASAIESPPVEYYKQNKNLKWVHTLMAGFDGLMPREFDDKIVMTNTRGIHGAFISEHVLALILTFARQMKRSILNQAKHVYVAKNVGFTQVRNSTALIIGFGLIGKETGKLLKAVGMHVEAVKHNTEPNEEAQAIAERFYSLDELEEGLANADYVILITPLNENTRGMIGEKQIGCMKRTGVLINVGRGAVVDEDALVCALNSHMIGGAALDATVEKPIPPDSKLWDAENIIITPHCAAGMPDYLKLSLELFCQELERYAANEPLKNIVRNA